MDGDCTAPVDADVSDSTCKPVRCEYGSSSLHLHGLEPTKMLRGALAFFRGASCSVKSRDPISIFDRMADLATASPASQCSGQK